MGLELHGIKLGFANITHLLHAVGNPQDTYPTVHVGGTNGKGSVVAFLGAMLRAAGYRAGRFTSPHLLDVRERFQVDGVCISQPDLEDEIRCFQSIGEAMDNAPTFFEVNTAIAFQHFARAGVDLALIEVGMGGRLDSTNVLHPELAVITNIGLEHTQFLGSTLEEIAFEKAGILKPGVPAVVGERHRGPREVILRRAKEVGAPVTALDTDFHYSVDGPPWDQRFSFDADGLRLASVPLALAGRHQAENAALATAAALALRGRFPRVDGAAITRGLAEARWPCRLERVLEEPPVIIDVAHNVAGATRLAEALGPCVTILACASDKDVAGMIASLAPCRSETPLILTAFTGARALPVERLAAAAGDVRHTCVPRLEEAIARGLALANAQTPLLITGSVFTAGEARRILRDTHGAPDLRF